MRPATEIVKRVRQTEKGTRLAKYDQYLMEVALDRVKRQVRPREFQVFDFCTVKEWPVAKVAGHLNLIRPQVYYLNKKVARMIRIEIEKLRAEVSGQ